MLVHSLTRTHPSPMPLEGAQSHPSLMRRATLVRLEKVVLDLFAQHDFHSISLKQVAAQSHVSLQTLYKYFGGKEQLVSWVVDHTLTRLAKRMIEQLRVIEDFRQRLGKTLWIMLDFFDRQPQLVRLLSTNTPVAHLKSLPVYESPELIEAFLGLFRDGQKLGQLRKDVSARLLMDVFMGILTRVVHMHQQRRESGNLLDQQPVLLEIIWNALHQEGTKA
ncbi:MAG: TetR/AcrR family transcriptional regulator, partial [Limnobacter sp.]|nr:TetR/AcrR family transcriptional regulator [Limnobacter sp.]